MRPRSMATVTAGVGVKAMTTLWFDGMSKSPAPANKPLYLSKRPMFIFGAYVAPIVTISLSLPW